MDDLSSAGVQSLHQPHDVTKASATQYRKTYITGIGLLLVVVLLWTSSNFVTQDLFEEGYNKPFLITYLNTSSFALYLVPFALRRAWRHGLSVSKDHSGYEPILRDDAHEQSRIVTEPDDSTLPPLTTRETAQLAMLFCAPWFLANWSLNAGLEYTSVASATILSSMSGFFTLCIGRVAGIDTFSVMKVGAVLISFCGVVLVSLSDSLSRSPPATGTSSSSTKLTRHDMLGDALSLLSAFLYALYVTLLKVRIRSESRVDMQLFFGFVGAFNIVVLWPMGFILHFFGAEQFGLPQSGRILAGVLINMAITLSSDFIYVLAMLKTSPLVVTIGLSLTMPLAVIGDVVLGHSVKAQVVLGATLVLAAFAVIGVADSDKPEGTVGIDNWDGNHPSPTSSSDAANNARVPSRVRFQEEDEIIDVRSGLSPGSTPSSTPTE